MSLTRWLAVGFFFCFAVALQAQPAGSAKQISQEAEVFSLDRVAPMKRPLQAGVGECCFCDRNAANGGGTLDVWIPRKTLAEFTKLKLRWSVRETEQRIEHLGDRKTLPTKASRPFAPTRRPYFSSVSPPGDIREINLDDLKKIIQRDPKDTRPLLINFWATWCDPCREEFPDLVKLDVDYRSKGLNFVAISLDDISDIKTAVPKFLKEMKAEMPVVLLNVNDPEPAIKTVDAAWDGQLPATFLYDKDGKVVYRHFGKIDPVELRAAIDKAVGTKQ
jgi:thiol-disulfide isomerase/thioredoxin